MTIQIVKRLLTDSLKKSPKSILLLGPRQTGKSTLINGLKPDLKINLALENEFLRYSSDIDRFTDQIKSLVGSTVFIDEVQRLPGLLNSVQAVLDDAKGVSPLKFYLSGSSARKLKRGGANLLPGRILSYSLGGLCAQELNYQIESEKALSFGFLPEHYFETNLRLCEKLLINYSAIYLKEEIQSEALTRNIQGFARFLMVIAQSATLVMDLSKIALKAKVPRSSAVRFVELLEDTLVAHRVFVFEDAEGAEVIRHPKLYFFDGGVLNGLLQNFIASSDRIGLLFEQLLYSQIKNSAMAQDVSIDIKYFRTRHGVEVDFIVTLRGQIWAIEAKVGDVSTTDLKGLQSFREYFPKVDRCVVASLRELKRTKDGILICDWVTLLQEMGL
jgi:predicted AAA+ superfamily ATPase